MVKQPFWTRRDFLKTSGLATLAASLPSRSLLAQGTFTRYNVESPEGLEMLEGYKRAIKALLALPPSNPLNWYRLTLIHTLDCPHGNWWFLPWHRGYIGFIEQILRKYSGNPNFALPYWDWTANPEVPATFFGSDNPLDPTSEFFIKTFDEFQAEFTEPINAYYANLSAGQEAELEARGLETPDLLWDAINPATGGGGYFFNGSSARCLTAAQPSFAAPPEACVNNCDGTPKSVAMPMICSALAPTQFVPFGSDIAEQHSETIGFGVLEGQPHNHVHNCVGGFMLDFMSPVDPIFFMHHSNIERFWIVWTQKQEEIGGPTLPTGDDLEKWSKEPFLFYVNAEGQTLSTVAGDFAEVGSFDYKYTSGSDCGLTSPKAEPSRFSSLAEVPPKLFQSAAKADGPELFAHVEVDPKGHPRGKSFHVLVDPPEGMDPNDASSPHHVATLAFFGSGHGHSHGLTTFVVPISEALRRLSATERLKKAKDLRLVVVTEDHKKDALEKAVAIQPEIRIH